ncbi:MAG TPA: signal peptidase I [Myxococcales bacterium]|jgi:signal peptidase I
MSSTSSNKPPTVLGRLRTSRRVRDLLSTVAFVLAALVARSSLADHYVVPSGSMLPTVQEGDHIAVDKLAFGLRVPFSHLYLSGTGPSRFDVVVLESPEDGSTILLKRVVALPGDRVAVKGGRIVVQGVPADLQVDAGAVREAFEGRSHPLGLSYGGGPDLPETTVPAGSYLVLGDNRGNSHDGRSFGLVPRAAILGRAAGVFWRGGSPIWQGL